MTFDILTPFLTCISESLTRKEGRRQEGREGKREGKTDKKGYRIDELWDNVKQPNIIEVPKEEEKKGQKEKVKVI